MANQQTLVNPATGAAIPAYLSGVAGVATGHEAPTLNQSRIVAASLPGKGKSSLLHNNGKALVLDPEWGGKTVKSPRAIRFGPTQDKKTGLKHHPSSEDYLRVVQKVVDARKAGSREIEMLGVDTLNSLLKLRERELMAKFNVTRLKDITHGDGFTMVTNFVQDLLTLAESSGMGWFCCVHVGVKSVRTDDGEKIVHDMTLWPTVRNLIEGVCDHRFYLDKCQVPVVETKMIGGKPKEVTVGQRTACVLESKPGLKFKPGQFDDMKVRVPFEDEIVISEDNGWADLEAAYAKAVAKLGQ